MKVKGTALSFCSQGCAHFVELRAPCSAFKPFAAMGSVNFEVDLPIPTMRACDGLAEGSLGDGVSLKHTELNALGRLNGNSFDWLPIWIHNATD